MGGVNTMNITSNSIRLQYLEAMGLTQWVRRDLDVLTDNVLADNIPVPSLLENKPVHESVAEKENSYITATPDQRQELWRILQARVTQCTSCELHKGRKQTVFGIGHKQARLLIVGEAPGVEEDSQGEPFVGPAGKLLNNMLFALGLQRSDVYIANILKCRPPDNRDPRPDEVKCCHSFIQQQMDLIQPDIILAVGRIAAQNLLKSKETIGRLRGKQFEYGVNKIPLIATYHPAYLLRSPKQKSKAWQDLLQVRAVLEKTS